MTVRILTSHPALPFLLQRSAPAGVKVDFPPVIERRGADYVTSHEVFVYVADIGKDVAVGLFSAWLYDHLRKCGAKSVEVDGKEVEVSESAMKTAFEAKVTHKF